MKKLIALLLALFMCVGLIACGASDDADDTLAPVDTGSVGEDGRLYDANGYLMDNLGQMDFEGKEIRILGWSNIESSLPEFSVEAINGDVVNDAAFKKNAAVTSRLNVKLAFETAEGWIGNGGGQEHRMKVQNAAGTDDIHIIATYSMGICSYMMNGYLADIEAMPHVDLTQPWWNQSVAKCSSIYGHTYGVTGDIAPSYLRETYCIFFNKKMASDNKLGDIYKIYDDGDWTLSEMMTLSKKVGSDVDGMGTKNLGDKFGFTTFQTPTDAFVYGWGLKTMETANDGSISVSESFGSEKFQELLSRLVTFSKRDDALFDGVSGTIWNDSWKNGDVLFTLCAYAFVPEWIDAGFTDFGLLPLPKYDDDQAEHYTCVGFYHTMYGVARTSGSDEAVGATLECLASECYRKVTPAYFENTFQLRYASGSRESDMFEEIKNVVIVDAGRVFVDSFGISVYAPFRNLLYAGDTGWMGVFEGFEGSLKATAKKINEYAATLETE